MAGNGTTPAILFHTELRPRRGLSPTAARRAFWLLLLWVGVPAGGFFIAGAWPVIGFLGLEVILLAGAMWVYFNRAASADVIELTEHALTLRRMDAKGRIMAEVSMPPHWARVALEEPMGGQGVVVIRSHGAEYRIAPYLSRAEREGLAARLKDALSRVRV